jgi:hypothetical protein
MALEAVIGHGRAILRDVAGGKDHVDPGLLPGHTVKHQLETVFRVEPEEPAVRTGKEMTVGNLDHPPWPLFGLRQGTIPRTGRVSRNVPQFLQFFPESGHMPAVTGPAARWAAVAP